MMDIYPTIAETMFKMLQIRHKTHSCHIHKLHIHFCILHIILYIVKFIHLKITEK